MSLNHIFENGQWVPCTELLEWEDQEGWEQVLERNGLHEFSSPEFGGEDRFSVHVHPMKQGETFPKNKDVTHLLVLRTLDSTYYFYCTGILVLIDMLHKLALISCAEHISSELKAAVNRIENVA